VPDFLSINYNRGRYSLRYEGQKSFSFYKISTSSAHNTLEMVDGIFQLWQKLRI